MLTISFEMMYEQICESEEDRVKRLLVMATAFRGLQKLRRRRENKKRAREKQRRKIRPLFLQRDSEGAMEILFNRHLKKDENLFEQYFRVSFDLFEYVLSHIVQDINSVPSNCVPVPIQPAVKLAITLRLVIQYSY